MNTPPSKMKTIKDEWRRIRHLKRLLKIKMLA